MVNQKIVVSVIVPDPNHSGKLVGVSRKDNHTAFGYPGGKVDEGEEPIDGAIRELFEETGIRATKLEKIFEGPESELYYGILYKMVEGTIPDTFAPHTASETGVVKWIDWSELTSGPFGAWNGLTQAVWFDGTNGLVEDLQPGHYYIDGRSGMRINIHAALQGYYVMSIPEAHNEVFAFASFLLDGKVTPVSSKDYHGDFFEPKTMVDRARVFAIGRHISTRHFYGKDFYSSTHLVDAFKMGMKHIEEIRPDKREKVLAALWLHDSIEDARTLYATIKKLFDEETADIVFALTNNRGKTRAERANQDYYDLIKSTPGAKFGKLVDRVVNVKKNVPLAPDDMYRIEYLKFRKDLWVSGELEPLWEELDTLIRQQ